MLGTGSGPAPSPVFLPRVIYDTSMITAGPGRRIHGSQLELGKGSPLVTNMQLEKSLSSGYKFSTCYETTRRDRLLSFSASC